MKNIKKISLVSFFLLILSACGAVKEGFKNQKKDNTDEFLVEKKAPLVMPPSFNELPIPKEINVNTDNDTSGVKELISKSKSQSSINKNLDKPDGNLESKILDKIKK